MSYPWEEQYLAARQETDPARLPQLIAFAETAIYVRLRRLNEERQALCEAASRLRRDPSNGEQIPIWEFDSSLTEAINVSLSSTTSKQGSTEQADAHATREKPGCSPRLLNVP
jgi:hypothetical protein